MNIYVDISNYYLTKAHTGIQRVVREFLFKNLTKKDLSIKCVYFDLDCRSFIVIQNKEVFQFLDNPKNYIFANNEQKIDIQDFGAGDIFLDMDGSWNNPLKRIYLYHALKQNKVKVVNFLYDLVPIVQAQFSHENTTRNFVVYLYAIYQYSDLVLFDSRSAELDFFSLKKEIGNVREIPSRVVKLGADISIARRVCDLNRLKSYMGGITSTLPLIGGQKKKNKIGFLFQERYLLFVGTVEPRKSQDVLLLAFENIRLKHPDLKLVFVGRAGWNNDRLIQYLENHELLNNSIFWLQGLSDSELNDLYRHAYICVYLSKYEGFGLPIAESLAMGKLTIASNNSSMFEVGKHCADYVTYNAVIELAELLDLYLSHKRLYEAKLRFIRENYIHYSWDMTANSVGDVLRELVAPKHQAIVAPDKLQFVFISIDANKCEKTIAKIDKYISFVKEYIVVTRADMMGDFAGIKTINKIKVVDEKKILGKYAKGFAERDHQSKNWLLRCSLLKLSDLNDMFVMLDDDNQPFRSLSIENFISNGKYNAYYYYDLLSWKERMTEYDAGQYKTSIVLDKDGYELLSYSSHRPQIIDKRIWQEVVNKYFDIGLSMPIDEWSIYFNYAVSNYPMLFNKKIFDTLSWPGNYSDWVLKYEPYEYNWYNYYPDKSEVSDVQLPTERLNNLNIYRDNVQFLEKNRPIISVNDMIHGVLRFRSGNNELFLFGVPYYFESREGTWIDFPLNLKWLGGGDCRVELGYFINGNRGHFVPIPNLTEFDDRTVSLKISCTSLKKGNSYDLLIDVKINEKHVYGKNSPYMIKLFVV